MNGLFRKTIFNKLILVVLLICLLFESLIPTTSITTVYASNVTNAEDTFNATNGTSDNTGTTDIVGETNTGDTTNSENTTSTTNTSLDMDDSSEIEISKEFFPDEIFRTYITNHYDIDENQKLSQDEISQVENIDVSNMDIEDLSGIEYFTNIEYLYCNDNKLQSLNLNSLVNMTVLNCSYNHLTSIDLSKCSSLISLDSSNNAFAISLDDNQSFDLANLKDFQVESSSNWSDNALIDGLTLTLSEDSATTLITYDYFINAPLLIDTYVNFTLVVASDKIEDIDINETTFPDLSFRTYIEDHFDTDNDLVLSTKERNAVTYLFIPSQAIVDLTGLNYFPNLVYLNFDDNAVEFVDLNLSSNLRGIYCSNNKLAQMQIKELSNLEELYCSNNLLTEIETSSLMKLTKLYCDGNLLFILDTSNLSKLLELNCSNNNLYCLDLSTCTSLEEIECKENTYKIPIDENNTIDLSTMSLLDLTKTSNWSEGTLEADHSLLLDDYTEGMTITYTYASNASSIDNLELNFTLLISPAALNLPSNETEIVQNQTVDEQTLATSAQTPAITEQTPTATEQAPTVTEQTPTEVQPNTVPVPATTSTPVIATYQVSFNGDGGSETVGQSISAGATATSPANPTKSGCLFENWYNGDSPYDFNTIVSCDITLTAHWNIITLTKPQIKSLKNSKKSQLKVSIKSVKNIDGYEVSYSTYKNAKKNATITNSKKAYLIAKNLIQGKKYYVRIRTYCIDSTGSPIYSKYSKIKKTTIKKGLSESKATSTSATIKSCKISADNNVHVTVKLKDIIKSKDNYYYLFQLPSFKNHISKNATPLDSALKGTSLKFDTSLNLNTSDSLLYSKFVVAVKVKSGYKIISKAKYITNPQKIADYTYSFPKAETKKGLQINAGMLTDVNDLGVKNSAFNIPLNLIIAAPGENNYHSGIDYEYNGKTYWFRKSMVAAYDSLFRQLEEQDIVVTAIILLGWRDDLAYLITPAGREEGHNYYNFNTSDNIARQQLEATFSFLATRYASNDGNGKVVNWIIGNEINSCDSWNYAGTHSLSKYTQLYADSFRLAYTAITSVYSNAKLYVSLDQCWNTSNLTNFSGKEFLDKFASTLKTYGNIKWNLAYHAYPSPLTNPRFWKNENGLSQNNVNSPVISIYNINVLTNYIKKTYGSGTRIILSEQGFTSAQPYGEKVQAAAMAYSYYLAEFNSMIDAFILSRHVDNVVETTDGLNLGLWTTAPGQIEEAYQKKYAWKVYKYMDTPKSTTVTKFALKIIGTSSWKKIIPKYKSKKFKSMPNAN
ncbi:MAG: DUF5722 domain-containing protein [Lachnotalea sp.]